MTNDLFDAIHETNARLRLLSDIASELLLSTSPRELLCRLFDRLSAHLGLEVYFNYLIDEECNRLRLNSFGGVSEAEGNKILWLDFGEAVCGLVADERRRVVVEDVQSSTDPRVSIIRAAGVQAYVCHPLVAQGRILGTLSFGTRSRTRFTDDELDLLCTVSDQIAMALERVRLTQELERRASELAGAVAESDATLAQLEAVVSSMSEGVVITSLEGEPLMMNPSALDLLGFASLEECHGYFGQCKRIFEAHYMDNAFVPPEEWPVERIARGESFSEVEVAVRRRDTGKSWIGSFSGRPVRSRSGEVMLAAVTIRDITASKENERELKEAKEAAESASRAKDHFLAMLSHELRTPLTPVLTLVQALEGEMGLPAEFLPYIEIIRRNIELEVLLIDDLLDLTRIAKGKLQFTMAETDIHRILRHVLEIYRKDIEAKKLVVRFHPGATNSSVCGDATRLQQVFWNLVKNAVKFTPPGGEIAVSTCNIDGDWIRVEVTDTGVGIDPKILPQIFEPFEQGASSTTAKFGGLGLGLAISKGVIDQHKGVIRAESQGEGRGSRFEVTLATISAGEIVPGDLDAVAGRECSTKGRVLLVAPAGREEVIREVMEGEHFEVQVVHGVRGAMQAVSAGRFDLLLCCSVLPDGTGIDLIRNLNAMHGIKGILLAEEPNEETVRRSLEAGYREYLAGPVDPERLRQVVERVIGG